MERLREEEAARTVAEFLKEFLGSARVKLGEVNGPDFRVTTPVGTFLAEFKVSAQSASIATMINQVRALNRKSRREIGLVVVPYMGEIGKAQCRAARISWIDLSGNAHIENPGLLIHVEGKPNRHRRRGRPESVFSPTASRVTRWLLAHPSAALVQTELAAATSMDQGFVSRTVRSLEAQGFVEKIGRKIHVTDPEMLLAAWENAYDFSRHTILRAHAPSRTSEALCQELAKRFQRNGIEHAATGLAGAWLRTKFAGFRLVTFFVDIAPSSHDLDKLGVRSVERGENVWLVIPKDRGVFDATSVIDDVRCVHDVQLIVDLKGHPERSVEAAASVRRAYLEEIRRAS